jgi:hypothetical protein
MRLIVDGKRDRNRAGKVWVALAIGLVGRCKGELGLNLGAARRRGLASAHPQPKLLISALA